MKTFDENDLMEITAIVATIERAAKEILALEGENPARGRAKAILTNVGALYDRIQAGDKSN